MERYCINFPDDPSEWESKIVHQVDDLPFRCVHVLGQGAHCSVHSVAPLEDAEERKEQSEEDTATSETQSEHEIDPNWSEHYFNLGDVKHREDGIASGSESSDSEERFSDEEEDSGSSTQEWATVEVDGSTHAHRLPHKCVLFDSPMGRVEVVAKRFRDIRHDVYYEATRPGSATRLNIDSDARKYLAWLASQGKERVDTAIIRDHITSTTAAFDKFTGESLCHILLTDLVAKNLTPHVVMAFQALEHCGTGYLVQERITSIIHEELEVCPDLNVTDVASLYLQLFVTLHVLQNACGFLHHDLHADNIFIKRIDDNMTWKGAKMKSATHFSYDLGDGVVLNVPNCGYIIKIGDFGCCSLDIFGRRLKRLEMDTFTKKFKWGAFGTTLEGRHGYDGQLAMGEPPFDADSWRADDKNTLKFFRRLRAAVQGPSGKITAEKHRPAFGHVSDVSPLDVVKQVFVTDPLEFADFRATPDANATVICLSSVADLSKTPAVSAPKKRKRRRSSYRNVEEDVAPAKPQHIDMGDVSV